MYREAAETVNEAMGRKEATGGRALYGLRTLHRSRHAVTGRSRPTQLQATPRPWQGGHGCGEGTRAAPLTARVSACTPPPRPDAF